MELVPIMGQVVDMDAPLTSLDGWQLRALFGFFLACIAMQWTSTYSYHRRAP